MQIKPLKNWPALLRSLDGLLIQWIIITTFFCFCAPLVGQEPSYIHYGEQEGLPTSEVYQSIQDDRGYMWFATDRGLVRFDGIDFKVFGKEDGLVSDVIFGFHRDYQGRIWFYSHFGGVGYLQGDRIVIPPFNDRLIEVLAGNVVVSIYLDQQRNLWIGSKSKKFHGALVSADGKVEAIKHVGDSAMFWIQELDSLGFVYGNGVLKHPQTVRYFQNEREFTFDFPEALHQGAYECSVIRTKAGITVLAKSHGIATMADNAIIQSQKLSGNITMSLFEDSKGHLWIGISGKGARCFEHGDLSISPKQFLTQFTISSIFEDREGGFWLTTTDAGIFYAPFTEVSSKQLYKNGFSESVTALESDGSNLWIGTQHGDLFRKNGNGKIELLFNDLAHIRYLYKSQNMLWVGAAKGIFQRDSLIFTNFHRAWASTLSDDFWVQNKIRPTFSESIEKNIKIAYQPTSKDEPLKSFEAVHGWGEHLYFTGAHGLYRIEENRLTQLNSLWGGSLAATNDHLFLGTKGEGLWIFDGDSSWAITKQHGLLDDRISVVTAEDDTTIWVGTKKGISRLYINHDAKQAQVTNITVSEGLASNEVHAIELHNGLVWVGTNNGLSTFDGKADFQNTNAPIIQLENVLVNGQLVDKEANGRFGHESSVFEFRFTGITHRSLEHVMYQYKLEGYDEDWMMGTNRQLRYMLLPGDYEFKVMAMNRSGIWSKEPATYTFSISAPIWQKWWFQLMVLLAIFTLILGAAAYRLRQVRKQGQLELDLTASRLQGLTAQLNPHFLYNAMNSIHNYIRKNDREQSSEYLVRFSRLIRQTLDNSMDPLISIGQEISLVKRYLSVEQMRFKDRLTFEVMVSQDIHQDKWKIPGQLIQPYVENAIWHGLQYKEGPCHVEVTLELKNLNLVCVIRDNGIGRQAASDNPGKNNGHHSQGMRLGKERLELMSRILNKPASVLVEDLKNEVGQAMGTKVTLTLPIIEN